MVARDAGKGSTRDTDVSDCDMGKVWSGRKSRSDVAIAASSGERSPNAICEVVDGDRSKGRMIL